MTQGVMTVVTEILPGRVEALVALLDHLDAVLDGDEPGTPIVDLPSLESVHFARFVVLPKGGAGADLLLFTTAYDGPRAHHLAELAKRASAGLCEIYEHCEGFSGVAREAPATLIAYLERSSIPHGAMHVGYVGRTVRDIRGEETLRRFIQTLLDETPDLRARRTARAIRDAVIRRVKASDLSWALSPRSAEIARDGVESWWTHPAAALAIGVGLLGGGLGAFVFGQWLGLGLYVAAIAGAIGLVVALLRAYEGSEPAKADTNVVAPFAHAEDEDYGVRNQISHLVDVKPGAFRRALLRAVLFAVELRARVEFYRGDLGGLSTIHCAHWAIIDGPTPRLFFSSNYDGSWERYLGDFIEEAGGGMTSVWSNTVDFPRARFLLWDGATNERVFKAWTREKQVRTQVWYAAKPDISIRNVNDNSRLRDGLRGTMTEEEARAWLRLL